MKIVDIYDQINSKRLLGHLAQRPSALPYGRFSYAVMPRVVSIPYSAYNELTFDIQRVEFEFTWVSTDDGWTQTRALVTSAPLSLLRGIPDFRFPGESDYAANCRRHYA